jgi:hypothetical protein
LLPSIATALARREMQMIVRELVLTLPLRAGDKVVSAVQWQDKIVVITERGKVFTLTGETYEI